MSLNPKAQGTAPGPGSDAREPLAGSAAGALMAAAPVRQRRELLYFALRDKRILVGAAVVLFFLILSIVGPVLDPTDPQAFDGPTGAPPSADFWFGTTTFGQDVFAQFANGLQATFLVGLLGGGARRPGRHLGRVHRRATGAGWSTRS